MYVLDTDHFSLLEWGSGAIGQRLHERIKSLPKGEVVTTIITFEEQTRGWLALQSRARTIDQQVNVYRKLKRHLDIYRNAHILDFDQKAGDEFEKLKGRRIRIGTVDLKIASIPLANDAIVLTRNAKDFSRIPNLRIANWTV